MIYKTTSRGPATFPSGVIYQLQTAPPPATPPACFFGRVSAWTTFVDPLPGWRMNETTPAMKLVRVHSARRQGWLFYERCRPDFASIRANHFHVNLPILCSRSEASPLRALIWPNARPPHNNGGTLIAHVSACPTGGSMQ